ncbi:GNAT family acetyltransferase [Apiospora kogelbergensis]|uniref:GNAT family acetyltransferase n=1 Tax=Apiospora kogelbergensis TaxID=1337665 RepID=A0AAW0QLN6_9PEZI
MALPFKPLASLAPQFTMARCTPADVPQLWDIYSAAFLGTRFCYFWPASRAAMARWSDLRFRKRFQDPTDHEFKVVDGETGQIAGFVRWLVPEAMGPVMEEGFRTFSEAESGLAEGVDVPDMAEGAPAHAWTNFFEPIKASGVKWDSAHKLSQSNPAFSKSKVSTWELFFLYGIRADWKSIVLDLTLLCVHPSYQGRGLSNALLKPMLDLADQLGVTAYLEALENATPVYEKLGFRRVDEIVYDESKTGHEGVRRIDVMLREPMQHLASQVVG